MEVHPVIDIETSSVILLMCVIAAVVALLSSGSGAGPNGAV